MCPTLIQMLGTQGGNKAPASMEFTSKQQSGWLVDLSPADVVLKAYQILRQRVWGFKHCSVVPWTWLGWPPGRCSWTGLGQRYQIHCFVEFSKSILLGSFALLSKKQKAKRGSSLGDPVTKISLKEACCLSPGRWHWWKGWMEEPLFCSMYGGLPQGRGRLGCPRRCVTPLFPPTMLTELPLHSCPVLLIEFTVVS